MGKRYYDRLRHTQPVNISLGGKMTKTNTVDVSHGGLFVATDRPPPLRSLVRFDVELAKKAYKMTAMVTHVVVANDPAGRVPGVGLKLYGIGSDAQRAWSDYVNQLRMRMSGALSVGDLIIEDDPEIALEDDDLILVEELAV